MSSEEEESNVSEEVSEEEVSAEEEVSEDEVDEDEESEEEARPVKKSKAPAAKGGKKDKDPNKPKRNMSAYFLFSTAQRARIKSENPGVAFGDLARLISAEFKALPEKERRKWDKKAAEDKERYEEEMRNYVGPDEDSDEAGGKKRKKKAAKDPNKPKRNMSAFFLYSTAHRAEVKAQNPGISFGEVAKIISQQFKSLPQSEKSKWEKKAAKDKARYQEEMKAYNARN